MKQHIDTEQFRALPEAHQRALVSRLFRRDHDEAPDESDIRVELSWMRRYESHVAMLSVGVLLEYLHEESYLADVAVEVEGWDVILYEEGVYFPGTHFRASDLIDALWAAVCAVLEREVRG